MDTTSRTPEPLRRLFSTSLKAHWIALVALALGPIGLGLEAFRMAAMSASDAPWGLALMVWSATLWAAYALVSTMIAVTIPVRRNLHVLVLHALVIALVVGTAIVVW